jgi:hypothetical protein
MPQAKSLRDLMRIRAHNPNRKFLKSIDDNLGTALGFKKRTGEKISDEPAIIVFVPAKINPKWIPGSQLIPKKLKGPDGLWCPIDVVEGGKAEIPDEVPEANDELCENLRGAADKIWVGSQISSWNGLPDPLLEDYSFGTIGAFVRSRHDKKLGLLTNAHVGMSPGTNLYHPVPWGTKLATTHSVKLYDTDKKWYALPKKASAYVRTDCAFAKIAPDFDLSNINPYMMDVGRLGETKQISLDDMSIIGQKVMRVGRTTGKRYGTIVAFGYEFIDQRDVTAYTDLLIVGDDKQPFAGHGDSGSLIVLDNKKREPVGLLWGGEQQKLRTGYGQEKWAYGICLDRVLDALDIELVTDPMVFKKSQ